MNIVIFGLTISSTWGNGHATLWRALCRSLVKRGHRITFFERDESYYRDHRNLTALPGMDIVFYPDWASIRNRAAQSAQHADLAIVTSYCPDGTDASDLVLNSSAALKVFYDLDTPVTLSLLARGQAVPYLPAGGLAGFDLVLSYSGGETLKRVRRDLGARRVVPLYGSVDPESHFPVPICPHYRADLSYIGTYAQDRQDRLEKLFLAPAARLKSRRFTLAGSLYPPDFPWAENIFYFQHLPPAEHAAFYGSSRLTLNITREAMAHNGYCPSGRLFEAAACGAPILSDYWEGLDLFFEPGREILVAHTMEEAIQAIQLSDEELRAVARAARERVLAHHTSDHRARELEDIVQSVREGVGRAHPIRWGIVPAAGAGTRIQPLAFSKELLPVGSRLVDGVERPRAVSEFLVERMLLGGANRICFVLSPSKSDIFEYYSGIYDQAHICYVVQPHPAGLCDALFRAVPLIHSSDLIMIGLPDTVWFPATGFQELDEDVLSFLLFHVDRPELFDAVVCDENGHVLEIQVKSKDAKTDWIWGAFQMPGDVFLELHALWLERHRRDEYFGTLVNAYLERGGRARGVRRGQSYVDVGTLNGYREAHSVLMQQQHQASKHSPEITLTAQP